MLLTANLLLQTVHSIATIVSMLTSVKFPIILFHVLICQVTTKDGTSWLH